MTEYLGDLSNSEMPAFQEIEGVAGQRVEDVVVGHDILLSPMRRALEDEAVSALHLSRKLAAATSGFVDDETAAGGPV